jgi:hypothetical protein
MSMKEFKPIARGDTRKKRRALMDCVGQPDGDLIPPILATSPGPSLLG